MTMAELEAIEQDVKNTGLISGAVILKVLQCYGGETDPNPAVDTLYNAEGLVPCITDRARTAIIEKSLKPCPCGGVMKIIELDSGAALVCTNSDECLTFIGGEMPRMVQKWHEN